MVTAWVALGSNVGDRRAHLVWAVDALRAVLSNLRCSSIIETAPVDVPDVQRDYLNAVVVGQTSMPPAALLGTLLKLEQQRGRERRTTRGARTLDLDLLFYGHQRIHEPDLVIPHPRFRERRFVLEPMVELDPTWVDPDSGKTVATLLAELPVRTKGA